MKSIACSSLKSFHDTVRANRFCGVTCSPCPPQSSFFSCLLASALALSAASLALRPDLGGQATRLRRLGVVAVLGGVIGGLLLLITPPGAFRLIVPWLIAFASAAVSYTHLRAHE